MSRPLRIEFPGAVYHVTGRGNARQRIYRDDEDREQFLSILSHVVDRYDWLCHAYCLMDNHYHLLIETPKANLSLGMRQLNGLYTQAYNRLHRRVGHLFQGRFKAILVEKETHLLELCRYVVLNPVRAKRVKNPGKWKWSSYRATVGEAKIPDYLTADWVLGQFGRRSHEAQKRYREFVAEGIGNPSPWEKVQGQVYLGGKEFVKKHQPDRLIREVPRRQTQAHRPELKALFRGKASLDPAISEAYRRYGYRMAEIAEHLAVHYSTVSRRLKRAEEDNV
jgi:REP element-mobilizing transposase RayT